MKGENNLNSLLVHKKKKYIEKGTRTYKSSNNSLITTIWKYRYYYLMLLPVVVWYAIFCYVPMYGVTLAFKSYNFKLGILDSPWIGLENFTQMFSDFQFMKAFGNTIIISLGKLIFHFPLPILLALLMNEISNGKIAKFFQTVFTFPHLISWVVLSGIIINIFGSSGIFNQIRDYLGLDTISLLTDSNTFRPMIYITHIWKEIGWDSIIYMAALSGINPELYEAAKIDGANRLGRAIHVSWPGIKSTVAILLILAIGNTMGIGSSFDQIFNLYSSPVYSVADTVDTYIYRTTFTTGANFGYTTAIGLFKSLINLVLIFTANKVVKLMGEDGLY